MRGSDKATVLLLAGTGEARRLASAICDTLPEVDLISSLAGVTSKPAPIAGTKREGGFGGVDGLCRFLEQESVVAVLDATHPFAEGMTRNAVEACGKTGTPLLRLERAPWTETPDDIWHHVPSLADAASHLSGFGGRALLTVGSKDLLAFRDVQGPTIIARMTEPPEKGIMPQNFKILLERGPFDLPHERALMSRLKIDLLVTKNSGGDAVAAKLDAARELRIPVLIVDRSAVPATETTTSLEDTVEWVKEIVRGS
ncbi:cobalt-precorrin-6A reductase [Aestuariispira ectoiniformans]|uniref:cobalt-precorrin-6A reductase n=1 Tax=Aestuariispira ectoiniformans TaxID=2775080 RepID=UPI00223B10A6|nr:cobalt-precorrin-6A reductase [Aestuariispira ectoiniformans]